MVEALLKVHQIGGSLAVIIPKDVVLQEGLVAGQLAAVRVSRHRSEPFGLFPMLTSWTKADRADSRYD